MNRRRRTKGSFQTDSGRIEVESPQLADFLANLSAGGGSGVLEEDLTVTFDGGVGAAGEGQVFEAGTSLEEVLRTICTGATATPSLQGLELFSPTNVLLTSGLGQTFLFEAGTEVIAASYDVTLVSPESFEPAVNSLSVIQGGTTYNVDENETVNTTTSEISGDFDVTTSLVVVANQVSMGANASGDFPFTFGGANTSQTVTFTASANLLGGGSETDTVKMEHVLPAFVLNLSDAEWTGLVIYLENAPSAVSTVIPTLGTIQCTKQTLQSKANYDGEPFNNEGYVDAASQVHVLCVPSNTYHTGTPEVVSISGIGSNVVSGGISQVYSNVSLPIGPAGLNMISVDANQDYNLYRFVNVSSFVEDTLTLNFS